MSHATLLLTGAAGFLGRAVAREFQQHGWAVHGVDIAPPENVAAGMTYTQMALPDAGLAELVRQVQPAACVHAAGRASVALSRSQIEEDFESGVQLTFTLLNALRREAPQCRTVLLSSAAVYGNPTALPITEGAALAPLSPYGFHKQICETLCEEFARTFELPTASARIFSAYGAGLRRQVVWDICEKALLAPAGVLQLRGTGTESRDFVHATDVAQALRLILEKGELRGERYNVAEGRETTIANLAETLVRHLGRPVRVEFGAADNPDDPKNWRADISRLLALGYQPRVSLDAGLQGVAQWAQAELGPSLRA